MIIENLIRLGRPMVSGGLSPVQVLRQISDVSNPLARNFLANVILVEIDKEAGRISAKDYQFGQYEESSSRSKKNIFKPDTRRSISLPFVLPSGGNPLHPQGYYGTPVYLLYDPHFVQLVEKNKLKSYLMGRLEKTILNPLLEQEVDEVVNILQPTILKFKASNIDKTLGILAILSVGDGEPYRYEKTGYTAYHDEWEIIIAKSQINPDQVIVAELKTIEEAFWQAKLYEGRELGTREGADFTCAFCNNTGEVLSAYSKSWNWYTPTWRAPFSIFLKDDELVKGISLCPDCYQSLTFGAQVFSGLTTSLPQWLTKEIFSPVDSLSAREQRSKQSVIYGGVIALPVIDYWLEEEQERADFVEGISTMLDRGDSAIGNAELHLNTITGLELELPASLAGEHYRLTMLYFSGEPSRGDIHLRATIEDVTPSTIKQITELLLDTYAGQHELKQLLFGGQEHEGRNRRFTSLPALLTRAYGTTYLWSTLTRILYRKPVKTNIFTRNVAQRLKELGRHFPDRLFQMYDEIFFYLYFREFLYLYNSGLAGDKGGLHSMRPWQELLSLLKDRRYDELIQNDVEDLGFTTGYLMRLFSNVYYRKTDQDYLRDRVMTFGSNLTPENIWKYGLVKMQVHAARHKIDLGYMEKLLGIVLMEYSSLKNEIAVKANEFLAAFWSGYALCRREKKEVEQTDDEMKGEAR